MRKQISKTVQQRKIRRLKPRHYEILVRYKNGQRQRQIAREMGVGEQWVSIVINSPVFHEELQRRLREEEDAVVNRMREREIQRVDRMAAVMHGDSRNFSVFAEPSIWGRLAALESKRKASPEGVGEKIIKALDRMDQSEREQPARTREAAPAVVETPATTTADASNQPNAVADQQSIGQPAEFQRTPTEKVQAARFYSRVLGEWIWIMFAYPGERSGFDELNQILRLTNGSGWRIFPRSGPPHDGYPRYFAEELSQLRGRTPEEVMAFHIVHKAKSGEKVARNGVKTEKW